MGLVGDTGKMLDRILAKIDDVNTLITEMAASAETQAANVLQVNGAVNDMDKMTQQNAAMVEETTAAARNLAGEADQLAALVTRFRLSAANGQANWRAATPAPAVRAVPAARSGEAPSRGRAPAHAGGGQSRRRGRGLDRFLNNSPPQRQALRGGKAGDPARIARLYFASAVRRGRSDPRPSP